MVRPCDRSGRTATGRLSRPRLQMDGLGAGEHWAEVVEHGCEGEFIVSHRSNDCGMGFVVGENKPKHRSYICQ